MSRPVVVGLSLVSVAVAIAFVLWTPSARDGDSAPLRTIDEPEHAESPGHELVAPPGLDVRPSRSEPAAETRVAPPVTKMSAPNARPAVEPSADEDGLIEGRIVPPAALASKNLSWEDLYVSWRVDMELERVIRSPMEGQPVHPDLDGAFTLTSVPSNVDIQVQACNPFGPEWGAVLRLQPREKRELVIELTLGVTILGRVIDEYGEPVAGADILVGDDESAQRDWSLANTTPSTDSEGRFHLLASRGRVRIATRSIEVVRQAEVIVEATEGVVRDLVLEVVRGPTIQGTVTWPNGDPVDQFEVRAQGPSYQEDHGTLGRFRLVHLVQGRYRVEVTAKRDGLRGEAVTDAVEAGGAPLALVLEEADAFELHGQVVDVVGKAVADFSVGARSENGRIERGRGKAGRVVVSGLHPGEWTVDVEAEGFQTVHQRVQVGPATPELRIVLPAGARIRGRVFDPGGAAIAGAWVGEQSRAAIARYDEREENRTDRAGSFDVVLSGPRVQLVAWAKGFSPSATMELAVEAGGIVDGVSLRLGEGCGLEGRVLDERGNGISGAQIYVSGPDPMPEGNETDADGAFVLHELSPGLMRVTATDAARPDRFASATIELAPGRVATIELRFEPQDPVRVTGTLTRAGAPLACRLWLHSNSFAAECASGADGRFDVILLGPGAWTGFACADMLDELDLASCDIRRFDVVVPDADEHTLVLDLDALPRVTSLEELER